MFMQFWSPTVTRSSTNVPPKELVFKMVEPTEPRKSFASLPYIKGVTEPLTHVLKKHDVTFVSVTSLGRPIRPALISGFRSMKRLGVFILPPGWDASPSQGYPQHYASTH